MATISFARGARSTGWFPIQLPDDRQIVCAGELNHHPVEIILDSGVGRTVIDAQIAMALGIKPTARLTSIGVTGRSEASTAGSVDLKIANLEMRVREPVIVDLRGVGAASGRPIGVILGRDLFEPCAVRLDFQGRRACVSELASDPVESGYFEAPLTPGPNLRRHTTICVNGGVRLNGMVDLGSDAPLYVSPLIAQELKLSQGRRESLAASVGVEGTSVDTVFTLPSLRIGGAVLSDIPTRIPATWSVSVPVVIGLPILVRFDLDLRFALDRMWMKPQQAAIAAPFQKDRSGIGAAREDNHLKIAFISPGSPASRAGLRVGDEIISVDDASLDGAFFSSRRRIGGRPSGTKIRLGLSDGRRIEIVLEDYF